MDVSITENHRIANEKDTKHIPGLMVEVVIDNIKVENDIDEGVHTTDGMNSYDLNITDRDIKVEGNVFNQDIHDTSRTKNKKRNFGIVKKITLQKYILSERIRDEGKKTRHTKNTDRGRLSATLTETVPTIGSNVKDDVSDQSNYDVNVKNDIVFASNLSIKNDVIEPEDDVSKNMNSDEKDTCNDVNYGNLFICDGSSNDSQPLPEAKEKATLDFTAVTKTKAPAGSAQNVKMHQNLDPNDPLLINKLSCDLCPYQTNKKLQMSSHLKAHTVNGCYSCNMCSYLTVNKHSLLNHFKVHTGVKPFTCDVCNKTFTEKSSLKTHSRSHSGEKPFACDVCNKTFVTKDKLRIHSRVHSGEKPYSCDHCFKSFSQRGVLSRHVRTHFGVKPYACDICSRTFIRNSSLKAHLMTHFGEKPYSCDVCDKAFTDKKGLKRHTMAHTGEQPYVCSVCNKSFTRQSSLTAHWRIHSGEKPFACDICNKIFSQKVYLTKHTRVHSGEKPYTCKDCDKTFTDKSNLTKHLRTHSGEKSYSCEEYRQF